MASYKLFVLLFSCAVAAVVAMPNKEPLLGGETSLTGKDLDEAKEVLQTSLTKLAAGEDGPKFEILELQSATRQVVSGSLYKYVVKLADENGAAKACTVKIWSQPWLDNGIQVTFKCDGQDEVVRNHSV
ncbi:PREDICTED: sarcocystatin-A-like isoform X2 [Rhagoletis zephyria]|uniref:sarcocystatin-A-like isoform X2 n=1 Tax=Rhagoletis zephyria TaxID=28612 RepID=UPI000811476C|nr:PREDICTED: sarcocystatin-A-like isoform X2 [Rhagoletis zephyria]